MVKFKKLTEMKILKYTLAIIFPAFIISCNTDRTETPSINGNEATDLRKTDSLDREFTEDVDQMRFRIKQRINEIEAGIEQARREREAEKNKKKWNDYDERIADREERRNNFQKKLDDLETQTKDGWQNFKTDVEEFFERDYKDTVRNKQL